MQKIKLLCIPLIFGLLQGCAAVVAGGAASSVIMAQDRRTPGTIIEDKGIQLKCMRAINDFAADNPEVHVDAVSYNTRVLLVGQVPNRQMRQDIEKSVKKVAKVKHVHNEIQVAAATPMMTRSKDSWITTKIKSEMAVTQDFNLTRVKVVTEDGIVYLMGLIKKDEEFVAVDIARHVKGVKKVVKIFEYEKA
ncbi:MAG: BON domain-containing protein [Candidatus Berkiella sp.]